MGLKDYTFTGRTFDEWVIGEEIITGARTITEDDNVRFAGLSTDWSATHVNEIYGQHTVYGSRISYGNVTFIVSTGLMNQTQQFDGTFLGMMDMRISYQDPVLFGDTIYCRFQAEEKTESTIPGAGNVVFKVLVFNQNDVQVAEERLVYAIAKERPAYK